MKRFLFLACFLFLFAGVTFAQPFAYIPNRLDNNVSVVDLNTNTVLTTIDVGNNPVGVITDEMNQKVYISNIIGNSVSVIDATTNTVEETILMSGNPSGLALSPDGTRLYVTRQSSGLVSVYDTADNSLITNILTGGTTTVMVNVSPDGSQIYASDFSSNSVAIIDAATNTVSTSVTVSANPIDVAFHPDGTKYYVANNGNGGNTVEVFDATTNTLTNSILAGTGTTSLAIGGSNFDKLYATNFVGATVTVIDLATEMVLETIIVNSGPNGIDVSADGNSVYVTAANSDNLRIIDATADTLTETAIPVGDLPTALGSFILPSPTINLMLTQTAVCANAGVQSGLGGGTPTGGVYSGSGATDDGNGTSFSFDPAAAGTGDATITYTVDGNSVSGTITVNAAPTVSFSTGGLTLQTDAGLQTGLGGGMPAGGVYSGNGVTDDGNGTTYSFDPAAAGEGENVITYTFTDANGCTDLQGSIITVTVPLAGDSCTDAIDISSLFGQEEMIPQLSESYSNAGYTVSGTDPTSTDCGFDFDGASPIWYLFLGDGNRYNIASASTSVDLAAILYSGECESLTELECNGPAGTNFGFEFQTEEGVTYALLVYNDFPNSTGSFDLEITNLGTVNVQDIRNTSFSIYPNPTTGWLQLEGFTADWVEVFDQFGRTVRTQKQVGNSIDLADLPAGVYTLRMQVGMDVYSARVVKE